jgi:3-oxoacyl-[acyl-carrier protein] reductase
VKSSEAPSKPLVLITGINGSIGSAIARSLLENGTDVIGIFRRNKEEIEQVYKDLEAKDKGRLLLVSDQSINDQKFEISRVTDKEFHRPITGLVHAAASIPRPKGFEETEWDEFIAEFYVQIGLLHRLLTSLINSEMIEMGFSAVGISTIYAHNIPPPKLINYITAKSALNGMFRALAVEYGPRGLRFNLISPGMTESRMLVDVPHRTRLVTKMNTPLRRIASPDDIVPIVELLLSERSGHITGQNISVAGGLSI